MIRLLRCMMKRTDISDVEFRRYWQSDDYRQLLEECLEMTEGIRFQANLVLKVDQNTAIQHARGTRPSYDGVVEIFWTNTHKAIEMFQEEDRPLKTRLLDYERQFIDFSESSISITEVD